MNDSNIMNYYKWFSKDQTAQWIFSLSIVLLLMFFMPEAYADIVGIGGKLKGKLEQLADAIKIVSGAGFIIGVMWVGISLLKGEPNYRYALTLIVGGSILYCASQLGQWMIH